MPTTVPTVPTVMLAMPAPFAVSTAFFECILRLVKDPELDVLPYTCPGTVIHLARDEAIKYARKSEGIDYLCFLDTDQLVDRLILRRLVRWCQQRDDLGAVAPIIVQRNGDPFPVCYTEVGQTADGWWRYQEQSAAVAAYLSQFESSWWTAAPSGLLPLAPQFPADMAGIPPVVQAGLHDPLLQVDAVGTGMVLLPRRAFMALEPDEKNGLFLSFAQGGEDFELSRRIRAAGFSIYADRGAWVGHMTNYSRGIGDLYEWHLANAEAAARQEAEDATLPPAVPALLNDARPVRRVPWDATPLPAQEAA